MRNRNNNNANVTCMFFFTTDKEILMSCLSIFCDIEILYLKRFHCYFSYTVYWTHSKDEESAKKL
jgi:hypothetical protein